MATLNPLALTAFTNISGTAIVNTEPVLELIASADDSDYVYTSTNATSENTAQFSLTNMPSDFLSMSTLTVGLRYLVASGTQVNTWSSLTARVFKADGTTPLTNIGTVAGNITTTTATNGTATLSGVDTAATKTDWDNAVVRIYFNITKSKGGDTLERRVTAAELYGTYTQSVTTHTLTGNSCRQNTTSTTGAVVSTHVLAGNSARQNTTSTTGAVVLAVDTKLAWFEFDVGETPLAGHNITGNSVRQNTTSTTGAVSSTHVLTGNSVRQNTTSTTGAVSSTHVLTGNSARQNTTSTTGAVVLSVAVTGNSVAQPTTSTTGAVSSTHTATGNSVRQNTTSTTGAVASGDARYARPAADLSNSGWTPSTGTDIYAVLDEAVASDVDYAYTTTNHAVFEVSLASVIDPVTSEGQVLFYRVSSQHGSKLLMQLKQGVTVLDEWTEINLPVAFEQRQRQFSGAVLDSITDYSALRVRCEALV